MWVFLKDSAFTEQENFQNLPKKERQFLVLVVSEKSLEFCPKSNFKGKQLEMGKEGKGY